MSTLEEKAHELRLAAKRLDHLLGSREPDVCVPFVAAKIDGRAFRRADPVRDQALIAACA